MAQYNATIEFFRTHEFANNGEHRCPEAAATKFLSKQRTSNICDAMYRSGNVTFYRDLWGPSAVICSTHPSIVTLRSSFPPSSLFQQEENPNFVGLVF